MLNTERIEMNYVNKVFMDKNFVKNNFIFKDFQPISCCNVVYTIIFKTKARHLKTILSKIISKEQFIFLFKCQIHDAVSLTQEDIHTINKNKRKYFVLKLDPLKSYDRVIWTFIRMILIQIGLSL